MKKLILILMLALTSNVFSQLAPPRQKIDLHLPTTTYNTKEPIVGPLVMLGGAAFTAAGLLTPPVMVGGSTTEPKPFIQQGVRAAAIITGSVVFTTGLVITIAGK